MPSTTQILIYSVLGEDATFFSGYYATRTAMVLGSDLLVPPGKVARCELWEALVNEETGKMPEPKMWVQCGRVAAPDPEGTYLCEDHMVGWLCDECAATKASYSLSGSVCVSCADDMQAAH